MQVIVDTSVLIDFLRQKDGEKTYFYQLVQNHQPVISIITVIELYSGKSAQTATGQLKLQELFSGLEIFPLDMPTASAAGKLRSVYPLTISDACIAQLAMQMNLPLATLDVNDFKEIKGLNLYS